MMLPLAGTSAPGILSQLSDDKNTLIVTKLIFHENLLWNILPLRARNFCASACDAKQRYNGLCSHGELEYHEKNITVFPRAHIRRLHTTKDSKNKRTKRSALRVFRNCLRAATCFFATFRASFTTR